MLSLNKRVYSDVFIFRRIRLRNEVPCGIYEDFLIKPYQNKEVDFYKKYRLVKSPHDINLTYGSYGI